MVCSPGVSSVFPAGSQGQGNFPAVWAAPGHDHISHNAQNTSTTYTPNPSLSLSLSLFSLLSCLNLAPPSSAVPISFPSLSLPSGDTPTQWSEPVSSDLWCTQHFLSSLWRPVLCPINSTVCVFGSRFKWSRNAVGLFQKQHILKLK